MLRRANKLRSALDYWLESEERLIKRNNAKGTKLPVEDEGICKDIFTDRLTEKDWDILSEYESLLRPCYEATLDLQDRPGDGTSGGLTNVIQDFEYILEELTAAYASYESAAEETLFKGNGILRPKSSLQSTKLNSITRSSETRLSTSPPLFLILRRTGIISKRSGTSSRSGSRTGREQSKGSGLTATSNSPFQMLFRPKRRTCAMVSLRAFKRIE
jgi:hypothetical protein